MSTKLMIIYNVADISFPVCGFVTEEMRQFLLKIYKTRAERFAEERFTYEITEEGWCELYLRDIIEALEKPLDGFANKVSEDIQSCDFATALAERENWICQSVDGTWHEVLPDG